MNPPSTSRWPIAPTAEVWQPLADAVADRAAQRRAPFTMRLIDGSPAAADPRFEPCGAAAWHATALGRPVDELYSALNPHARRNVAAARRRGVGVTVDDSVDAVRTMHALHVGLRRHRYQLLAQPREFFETIWERFAATGDVVTILAHHDGAPIAGALYLVWGDDLYYKFGASRASHLTLRPNEAIAWEALCFGRARGLRRLDWGLSDLDQPGLVAYKQKWATDEHRIATRRIPGQAPTPAQTQAGRTLSELTALLTAPGVPDPVCAEAGAILYRYFC